MFGRLRMIRGHLIWFLLLVICTGCADIERRNPPDTTKPSLSSTSPSSGATGVAVNTIISASFSEVVYFDSFTLTSNGGAVISGTSSGNGSNTISFKPSRILNYNSTYTAKITNVRDGAGNALGDVSWSFTTISTAPSTYHTTPDGTIKDVGKFNSMVLFNDKAIITYYNSTDQDLYITSTADGTTFSRPYKIDEVGNAGFSSLAIDSSGRLHLAYYKEDYGLMYATTMATNINEWTNLTIVDYGGDTNIVGKYPSIALDSNGKVHIAYYDETNTALKYATNKDGSWSISTIDSGLTGEKPGLYTSIKVDKNDIVHISYYDSETKNLKYINLNSTNWMVLSLDTTGNVGEFSSIYIDDNGKVYIVYNAVSAADGKRYIRIINNASGEWKHTDIVEVSSLTSNPIFVDSNGIMHLTYYSGGKLYYKSGVFDIGDWSPAIIVDDSGIGNGIYASIVADSTGKVSIAYYDFTSGDLKFAH
jgi:hypothetical protein